LNEAQSNPAVDAGEIRKIIVQHGRLTVDATAIDEDADLYSLGLTSLATVGIMLALENKFDFEFAESMLSRETFRSISSIKVAVSQFAT
jgi:acyl carrier protein